MAGAAAAGTAAGAAAGRAQLRSCAMLAPDAGCGRDVVEDGVTACVFLASMRPRSLLRYD